MFEQTMIVIVGKIGRRQYITLHCVDDGVIGHKIADIGFVGTPQANNALAQETIPVGCLTYYGD